MFRRISVVYPRGMQTGGPEALHQLVDALRSEGQDAVLVPRPGTEDRPRVDAYRGYDAPEARTVEDASDCAVLSPEDKPEALHRFGAAAPFCWWLSVDNGSPFRDRQVLRNAWSMPVPGLLERAKRMARVPLHDLQRTLRRDRALFARMGHLSQSVYAASVVHDRLGLTCSLLSDYTPLSEFEHRAFPPPADRDPVIAYNPVKSGRLVDELRPLVPEVRFVPLQGMRRAEVVDTLGGSMVYLDLGNHPGKDRLPREAALADSVVLVGRRGAAALREDVPLDDDFKIGAGPHLLRHARAAVLAVLQDPDAAWRRQDGYRAAILGERARFQQEARTAFDASRHPALARS